MKSDEHEREHEHEYLIKFKPLTIVFPVEREVLFRKLKAQKEEVDLMIENPDLNVEMKLKAMELSLKLAKGMAGILKTGEKHQINETLQQLKKDVAKEIGSRKRERERLNREAKAERLRRMQASSAS